MPKYFVLSSSSLPLLLVSFSSLDNGGGWKGLFIPLFTYLAFDLSLCLSSLSRFTALVAHYVPSSLAASGHVQ